jgi:hypothetical protein
LREPTGKRPAPVMGWRGACVWTWRLADPAGQARPAWPAGRGSVIAAVPRAAAGPCGWPGAAAVRLARPAATPWPAQRGAATGGAARPGPAARAGAAWRAGWPGMGAGTRDSPPFKGREESTGWRVPCGHAGRQKTRAWPGGPHGCPGHDVGQAQVTRGSSRRRPSRKGLITWLLAYRRWPHRGPCAVRAAIADHAKRPAGTGPLHTP